MFKRLILISLLCLSTANTHAFFGPKVKSENCDIKLDKNSYINPRSSRSAHEILELRLLDKNFGVLADSSEEAMRIKIDVKYKTKFKNATRRGSYQTSMHISQYDDFRHTTNGRVSRSSRRHVNASQGYIYVDVHYTESYHKVVGTHCFVKTTIYNTNDAVISILEKDVFLKGENQYCEKNRELLAQKARIPKCKLK